MFWTNEDDVRGGDKDDSMSFRFKRQIFSNSNCQNTVVLTPFLAIWLGFLAFVGFIQYNIDLTPGSCKISMYMLCLVT